MDGPLSHPATCSPTSHSAGVMHDRVGRAVRYLRLSLTQACPMRCVYCRPAVSNSAHRDSLLSPLEIEQLVSHLVERHGLRKLRLTGGEPTSRPELLEIVARVGSLPLADLAMTTNGLTLARDASRLKAGGLQRVNVSLDSLDPSRFAELTGVDALPRVLEGIDAALSIGWPVKLNTVVVRGQNDDDLTGLLELAATLGVEIRFIELMPMGPLADRWLERYVSEAEMRRRLAPAVLTWDPLPVNSAAARRYRVNLANGKAATVGFITAMSHPFCDACDRIRISADGGFYPCLMDAPAATLMPAIRPQFDPDWLDDILHHGLAQKPDVHPANGHSPMIQLGG